ncbi:hypothetical protein FJ651_12865 [Paucihalobacter ruber]|uniref:Aerotolerance regulator N-terminal domain-containing protein n=1 Tax=Paucihalobacter ruber TaxID=2567861 RepID=A0A506PH88_9FLAO|nr:BatA domain-containing protein [Paucihalobacter ruber]TPV32447.1 hypothetical protein FJ651_12865 [Paucihalobacter ruber]
MQFQHPELLYALLLLLIPIIIHLFQLRRFKKVAFTNVKFLKALEMQTRKSSQLKKWLVLLTRMGLLACIVLAFAQPFTNNINNFKTVQETVIYLDNSFSMEAKGSNGSLLNTAITELINTIPEDQVISLFTNDKTFTNTSLKAIKNELIDINFSTQQLPYNAAILNAERMFSNQTDTSKNLVIISDFQQQNDPFKIENLNDININLVQLKPQESSNVSIDSVAIDKTNLDNHELQVFMSRQGKAYIEIAVALYNFNDLVAKTAINFEDNNSVSFTIPANQKFNGKLQIEDDYLSFDNNFYFNINSNKTIKVLAVNQTDDAFLYKLYNGEDFDFKSFQLDNLNYNLIADQNLIVLNELPNIPNNLISSLKSFRDNGGHLVVIPSENADVIQYNNLLNNLNAPTYTDKFEIDKRISNINFSHPLLEGVFDKTVDNFQYPKVNSYFKKVSNTNAILSYEDNSAFLSVVNNVYVFSAALNDGQSNFKQSPLIVPIFYNMAVQSLQLPQLYYNIGNTNIIDIDVSIGGDDIITLKNAESSVIPLQQVFNNKVQITTNEFPETSGIVDVLLKENLLGHLSYNYNRSESQLNYQDVQNTVGANYFNNVVNAINSVKSAGEINGLWKWFVIFALCFLLIEMLILKFFK